VSVGEGEDSLFCISQFYFSLLCIFAEMCFRYLCFSLNGHHIKSQRSKRKVSASEIYQISLYGNPPIRFFDVESSANHMFLSSYASHVSYLICYEPMLHLIDHENDLRNWY
jgi:hypothetical protein